MSDTPYENENTPETTADRKVPPRVEVLVEAGQLIDGDRNVSYGTPTQNFTNIAEMWTTRLRHKLRDGERFTATDVADLMMLLKIARNIAGRKRDTYVDVAGYAGCGYEAMLEEQAQVGAVGPQPYDQGKVAGWRLNIDGTKWVPDHYGDGAKVENDRPQFIRDATARDGRTQNK